MVKEVNMIRIIHSLPNKIFKSWSGYSSQWVRCGPAIAGFHCRGYQDVAGPKKAIHCARPSVSPVHRRSSHATGQFKPVSWHDQRSDEEWRRSFKQKVEWKSFRSSYHFQEAIGWGSIIVLGIHFGRIMTNGSSGDNQKRRDRLLSSLNETLTEISQFKRSSLRRSILPVETKEGESFSCDGSSSSSQSAKSWPDVPGHSISCDSESSEDVFPKRLSTSASFSKSSIIFTHPSSSAAASSSSGTSITPSSTDVSAGIPSPAAGFKSPFDRVTQHCWGRVNNMIGGRLMSEGMEEKAVEHFKLASEAGYVRGQYNLGMCYELGKGILPDFKQAAVCFSLAANQGHPQAQYKLGTYHIDGIGDVARCPETAISLMTQAANGGVMQAQTYLGMYYLREDPKAKKALPLLKEAAVKKDPEAQYHLGVCYEFGWGVERNEAKAASLYYSASKKGHAPSLFALGLFYEEGLGGLPENRVQAREFYTEASSLGFEMAALRLAEMDSEQNDPKISPFFDSNHSLNSTTDSKMSLDAADDLLNTALEKVSIHTSCSAPELARHQDTAKDVLARGDADDVAVKSILHSLSCVSLLFPRLHRGFATDRHSDQEGQEWLKGTKGIGGQARFQVGGLDDDDSGQDWSLPSKIPTQRGLVSFYLPTAVV